MLAIQNLGKQSIPFFHSTVRVEPEFSQLPTSEYHNCQNIGTSCEKIAVANLSAWDPTTGVWQTADYHKTANYSPKFGFTWRCFYDLIRINNGLVFWVSLLMLVDILCSRISNSIQWQVFTFLSWDKFTYLSAGGMATFSSAIHWGLFSYKLSFKNTPEINILGVQIGWMRRPLKFTASADQPIRGSMI